MITQTVRLLLMMKSEMDSLMFRTFLLNVKKILSIRLLHPMKFKGKSPLKLLKALREENPTRALKGVNSVK